MQDENTTQNPIAAEMDEFRRELIALFEKQQQLIDDGDEDELKAITRHAEHCIRSSRRPSGIVPHIFDIDPTVNGEVIEMPNEHAEVLTIPVPDGTHTFKGGSFGPGDIKSPAPELVADPNAPSIPPDTHQFPIETAPRVGETGAGSDTATDGAASAVETKPEDAKAE